MTFVSIGDLTQTYLFTRQTVDAKTRISDLTQQVTTGQQTDLGKHLAGDFGPLAAIETRLGSLASYDKSGGELGTALDVMQLSIDRIGAGVDRLAPSLLIVSDTPQPALLNTVGIEALGALEDALSALNVSAAGRYLFGGSATDLPPVAQADTLMADLSLAVAGLTTPTDVINEIDQWFAGVTNGFGAVVYQGAAQPSGAQVLSNGAAIALPVRADDETVRATLKGLATAALLGSASVFPTNSTVQAELAERSAEALLSAQTGLAEIAARVGTAQNQLVSSQAANSAETFALEQARDVLIGADPYKAATKLESAQTELETLYAITARLARLNLADFLR